MSPRAEHESPAPGAHNLSVLAQERGSETAPSCSPKLASVLGSEVITVSRRIQVKDMTAVKCAALGLKIRPSLADAGTYHTNPTHRPLIELDTARQ